MIHPFNIISKTVLQKTIKVITFLVILGLIALCFIFITGPNPLEFLALVNSFDAHSAQDIISDWSVQNKITISFFSGFDFLWGFLWTNLLALLFIYIKKVKSIR